MAEEERRYRIPVVFEVASSGEREQAAQVLHALLTSWSDGIYEVPILDEHGAPNVPIQSWWFPESALKHVAGTPARRSAYAARTRSSTSTRTRRSWSCWPRRSRRLRTRGLPL